MMVHVNKYYMLHTYRIKRVDVHNILTMIENHIQGRRNLSKESIKGFIILTLVKILGLLTCNISLMWKNIYLL